MLNAMGYTLYSTATGTPTKASSLPEVTNVEQTHQSHMAKESHESKLFQALSKAVCNRDFSALNIDVQALRSSPQAKRALWPQLRALLKQL
jgi:DNA polymerase III psi subunit